MEIKVEDIKQGQQLVHNNKLWEARFIFDDVAKKYILCLGTVCNLNNSRFILNAGTRLKSYTGINLNFELEKQVAKIFGKSK